MKVRTATPPKSMRLAWSDGTIVAVGFFAKRTNRSAVAVQQLKLPAENAAQQMKAYWSDRLDALDATLARQYAGAAGEAGR